MPTPDRFPGDREEEQVVLTPDPSAAPPAGGLAYDGTGFKFRDSVGEFDPRSGSGLSEAQHRALRQLIHFIDDGPAEGFASGAYKETLPTASPFPTSIIWWESSSKLKKIVEKTITRVGVGASTVAPTPIIWKIYDTDGTTVLATITDSITYTGVFETSRTRVLS